MRILAGIAAVAILGLGTSFILYLRNEPPCRGPLLSTYGQVGAYERMYKSYGHGGFAYTLDSLRRLGIDNIELKDGECHPERHPDYRDVYEVTYP